MELNRITPEEAKERLDSDGGYVYLDVRTPEEFAAGHPPGARNIPILLRGGGGMQPNAEFVKVAEANLPKDAKIITGCMRGGRSLKAAQILAQAGYSHVEDMRGGYDGELDPSGAVSFPGWARRGLPVTAESGPGDDYDELRKKAD